tara:strand:+ start:3758 stop:4609 length:852 start_codon:yes stop_codon:yes gene_type:complete
MLKREHKVSNISSEAIFAIPAMKPSRVIFAVLFCLFLILSDIRYGSGSYLRSTSYDLIKPVTLLTRIPGYISEMSTFFFSSRQTLKEKIIFLEQENYKLKAINNSLEKLSIDLYKINSLWSSASFDKEKFSISKKNFLSSNAYQPLLVVDINQGQNLSVNNAVLSSEGLVGRINNLGVFSADVMLVQDIRSSVPVITSESSLHASLRGMGLGRMGELQFIKKTAQFQEGEKVYTSGLGDLFPEGILVGEVVSITDPVDSEFLKIEISFSSSPLNQDYFLIHAK